MGDNRFKTENLAHRSALLHLHGEAFVQIVDHLPVGAFACDADGRLTYYNRHAAYIWGREPRLNDPDEHFFGARSLLSVDGKSLSLKDCGVRQALAHGSAFYGEKFLVERPDGSHIPISTSGAPIYDASGRLMGVAAFMFVEGDHLDPGRVIEEIDRLRHAFLATLAHELRNPLAPIRSAVQLIKMQGHSSSQFHRAADVIDRKVGEVTRLIDDLLDISRITQDKLTLKKERLDVARLILDSIESVRAVCPSSSNKIALDMPQESVTIEADPVRMHQIVSGLIDNAFKYTEDDGSIWVRVEIEGGFVVIAVGDTGIGIADDMLEEVFEMFRQVDSSRGGLGLGLTLAKRLTELHGGTLLATSPGLGKGSEFVLRLPAFSGASEVTADKPDESSWTAVELNQRILVVDDHRDVADSFKTLLEFVGGHVQTAYDGEQAIVKAEAFRPHAILLDIGLPKRNGYEVARAIRQLPWGKRTTIIAVTGWGQPEDKRRALEAGCDYFMVKPPDLNQLINLLAESNHERKLRKETKGSGDVRS